MNIILASSSPRRVAQLKLLNIPFESIPADINEDPHPEEHPYNYTMRLALEKAREIDRQLNDGLNKSPQIIIGSDVTTYIDGKIIGKPENRIQAKEMIQNFAGRSHEIINGTAIIQGNRVIMNLVISSKITFREIELEELEKYLDTANWKDKAGAYAIQEHAEEFITKFTGDIHAVVGMAVEQVALALKNEGIEIPQAVFEKIRNEAEKMNPVDN